MMSSDEIRLELNKLSIIQAEHDENIRHNAIKETHWQWQKWIWLGTVFLLALGIVFR
ncbi:MAG: hypothetical protein GY694_02180 [Gammaproteobacteria bacterium]|nr:hypothetical protein [Gammaproteobacteria bacterium]